MAQIRGKRTNMKDRVLAPPGQDWQSHLDHVVSEGLSLSIIILLAHQPAAFLWNLLLSMCAPAAISRDAANCLSASVDTRSLPAGISREGKGGAPSESEPAEFERRTGRRGRELPESPVGGRAQGSSPRLSASGCVDC